MFCEYCGDKVSTEDKFCQNCGHNLSSDTSKPILRYKAVQKRVKVSYIFIAVLIIAEMFIYSSNTTLSKNVQNVQSDIRYIRDEIADTKERIAQENERQQERERVAQEKSDSYYSHSSEPSLSDTCSFLASNFGAWSACMKKESNVFGMGKRGLNAYYAMRGECSYLAGNDDTGLSYLCQNPNRNGCAGLKAPQSTINACYQCNGSNLWLRVYAMGVVVQCY